MANTWVLHLLPGPPVLHHGLELVLEVGEVACIVHAGCGGGERGDKIIEERISLIYRLCFPSVIILVSVVCGARRPLRGSGATGASSRGSTGVIGEIVTNLEKLY